MLSARPIAAAALIVAAAMAWAGVRRRKRQARAITNCMLSHQAVPGLRSLAIASRPPACKMARAGVYCVSARPNGVQGSATATVLLFARAAMSAAEVLTR